MIAVTGANGLVGSFIVKKLIDEGLPVRAVTRKGSDLQLLSGYLEKAELKHADVLDALALSEALQGASAVIHTAAVVSFHKKNRKKIFDINVLGTRHVVDACLDLGIGRLIQVSSVAALGRSKGILKIDEKSTWIQSPLNTDYSESKYLAELEVFRGMEEGLQVDFINPSIVLAPGDWDKSSARIFRYAWDEKPFYAEGSLNYVDVRDVAEMAFKLYQHPQGGQRFIANAGLISFKEFFEALAVRMNKKPPSIRVGHRWLRAVAGLESVRSWISGEEPLITLPAARLASENVYFDPGKATEVLKMKFVPLAETLDWCCAFYAGKITTNNQKLQY